MSPTPSFAAAVRAAEVPRYVSDKLVDAHGGSKARACDALRADPYGQLHAVGGGIEHADALAAALSLPFETRLLGHARWTMATAPVLAYRPLLMKLRLSMEHSDQGIRAGLDRIFASHALMRIGDCVVHPDYHAKNTRIARAVDDRGRPAAHAQMDAAFAAIQSGLTGEQRRALTAIAAHRIVVLTGGPGSGKSRIVREMCEAFPNTRVMAPTGRAARNASGRTVHYFKIIQEAGASDVAGAELVIVDEASMLSTDLMCAVLDLAPAGAHIVLVGDVDQLPPIDPGDVLRDIIQSGRCPVVTLTHNHRNASVIEAFAREVLQGSASETEGPAVEYLPCESFGDVLDAMAGLAWESSIVLSPHNVTRVALNRAMQLLVHGHAGHEVEIKLEKSFADAPRGTRGVASVVYGRHPKVHVTADGDVRFTATLLAALDLVTVDGARIEGSVQAEAGTVILEGDRVIVTRNTEDACNGDIGMYGAAGVMFPEEPGEHMGSDRQILKTIPPATPTDPGITLAYAVTVHKAQGSEFDTVVLPVTNVGAWDRTLLYTAITRAKYKVYILGALADVQAIATSARPPRPSILRHIFSAM